jgi:hypothetical protein
MAIPLMIWVEGTVAANYLGFFEMVTTPPETAATVTYPNENFDVVFEPVGQAVDIGSGFGVDVIRAAHS